MEDHSAGRRMRPLPSTRTSHRRRTKMMTTARIPLLLIYLYIISVIPSTNSIGGGNEEYGGVDLALVPAVERFSLLGDASLADDEGVKMSAFGESRFGMSGGDSDSDHDPNIFVRRRRRREVATSNAENEMRVVAQQLQKQQPQQQPQPPLNPNTGGNQQRRPCQYEERDLRICLVGMGYYFGKICDECVSKALPGTASNCQELNNTMCTGIYDCSCGLCRDEIEHYLNCAFGVLVQCQLQCHFD